MTNILKITTLVLTLCSGLYASQAEATFFQNTTGLTGNFLTETFDTNAGNGTLAGNQFSGLVFGAGNYVDNRYSGGFPNMHGSVIDDFGSGNEVNPTSINFSTVQSSVAFNYVSNTGTTIFSSYLAGNLVDSVGVATGYNGNFFGFINSKFDSIQIDMTNSNHAYIIDNLQSSQSEVPEPTSIALLGLGLFGFAASRRKSANNKNA